MDEKRVCAAIVPNWFTVAEKIEYERSFTVTFWTHDTAGNPWITKWAGITLAD